MPTSADIKELIVAERQRLGSVLPELTDAHWSTPSLCGGWTVREVIGHLVVAMTADRRRVTAAMLRSGMNFDKAMDREAKVEARRTTTDLIAAFEAAAQKINPAPLLGLGAPLTDIIVHSHDIAVPAGVDIESDPHAIVCALDFRTTNRLAWTFGGSIPRDTELIADDVNWRYSNGTPRHTLRGTGLTLLLHLCGREIADGDLNHQPG